MLGVEMKRLWTGIAPARRCQLGPSAKSPLLKAVVAAAALWSFVQAAEARNKTESPSDLVLWDSANPDGKDQLYTAPPNAPFRFSVLSAVGGKKRWILAPSIGRGSIWLTFDSDGIAFGVGARTLHYRNVVHEAALLQDAAKAKRRPTVAEVIAASLAAREGATVKVNETKELPSGDVLLVADGGSASDLLIFYAARSNVDGSYILAEVSGPRTDKAPLMKIATSLENLGRTKPAAGEGSLAPYTPLMMAAFDGRADVAATLLREGADVNRADDTGPARTYCTPLFFAASGPQANVEILDTLLEAGAHIEGDQRCVRPPLGEAVIRGKLASVRFLLSKKADPNRRSLDGDIPLIEAFANQNQTTAKAMLEELLRAGADVNGYRASAGFTTLIIARFKRTEHPALGPLLLERGADPRMTDAYGHTAFEGLSSQDGLHQEFTAAVAGLKGSAPKPVFSKLDDSGLRELFRFGTEARIGLRKGALQLIDPAGNTIGSWPACSTGWFQLSAQFLDLDGDRVPDVSAIKKDTSACAHGKCPPLRSFSLVLGLRGGQTRLMINYDATYDRLTGNGPIPASLRDVVVAELERQGDLDRAHVERLLPRYALMADGAWMYELLRHHAEAAALYKKFQPAKAAALLEELLAEATVSKMEPSLDPHVTEALNDLGFFLSEAGLNDRAVPVLRRVVARAPDRTVAYLNLADAEYTLGDAETARGHYRQYLTLMERAGNARKVPPRVADRVAGH
jgi:hypothetical protein